MLALAFVALSMSTLSLASPAIVGRGQTPLCPWNGIPDANSFTLLAVFKADSNVQKPLALSSLAWIGSAETTDSDSIIARDFIMADGGVTAIGFDGNIVGVSKPVAKEDGWLEFPRPDENGTPGSPAKVYCKLFNTSPHGVEFAHVLAVDGGNSDHFCLCQRSDGDAYAVIYGPVKSDPMISGYKYETCKEVAVYMLPA